jgi:hypothetical protein
MQIDTSDAHRANVARSMQQSGEPDVNITVEIVGHSKKQPPSIRSISFGILTSPAFPKYFFMQTPAKSKRKLPRTLKWRFPSATKISRRGAPSKAPLPNSRSSGGSQIDARDEHSQKAWAPIDERFETASNVIDRSELHSWKQRSPSSSTEEGMQIDESDEHFANAAAWIEQRLEPGSKVAVARD